MQEKSLIGMFIINLCRSSLPELFSQSKQFPCLFPINVLFILSQLSVIINLKEKREGNPSDSSFEEVSASRDISLYKEAR